MIRSTRTRTHTTAARLLAVMLAVTIAPRAIGSPADIVAMSAPDVGGEAPKAQDIADGDVSTSMQTGALQYSYPIAIPPGRLGFQPKVGLSYSSQAAIYGGIAAGWSLTGLPEIKWDGSRGIGDREWTDPARSYLHYVSDLAGGRPLIEVSAFEQRNADADRSFRAQNDASYARYERLVDGQDAIWRVLDTDGTTHYFGEGSRITGADAERRLVRAPITRSVDQFGNTIEYLWSFAADEYRIETIKYTSNPSQSLARFAEVRFTYVPAKLCWSSTKVGAQESFRLTKRFVDGASKLTTITAVAMDPTTFDMVQHTRTITLGYDASTENCNDNASTPATHAPYRQLLSIQESAVGPSAAQVSLPPVTFTYGAAAIGRTVQLPGVDWSDAMDHPYNLGWGYRFNGGTWTSVNAMMLDIDGDGLVDRLTSRPSATGDRCLTDWARNRGGGSFDPMPPISMPVLPWKNGAGGPSGLGQINASIAESCALNYQRTKRHTNDAPPTGPLDGAYLIYRWIDMNNDGLPDLVTAIQHSDKYNPNHPQEPPPFGPWPSCSGDQSACVGPTAACTDAAYACDQGPDCALDEAAFDVCVEQADPVSCDLVIYMDSGDGPTCMQRDGGVHSGPCDDLPEPGGPQTLMGPHKICHLFPWEIYTNLGRGQLSATPEIKLQPAPLESFNGDSPARAGGFAAGSHAVQDIDGDGYVDLILRGRYDAASNDSLPPYWWWIFPGDGKGGFVKDAATGNYLMKAFVVPLGAWPSVDDAVLIGDPLVSGDIVARAVGQLGDVNGDGLVDYFWREPLGPGSGIRSFSNARWLFQHAFSGDLTGPTQVEISQTFTDETVMSVDRKFIIEGWRTADVRRLDLDDDGRIDVYSSLHDAPSSRPVYFNTGGAMTQLGSPLGSNMLAAVTQSALASQAAASYIWEAKSDFADLDGDGIPEAISWNGTQMQRWGRAHPETPPRLMTTVANGRGLTTSITYASTNDTAVVNNDPFDGTSTPSTQWVVASIETKDSFAVNPEKTTYHYNDPWFGTDDEGRYAFRGFKEVQATNPRGAVTTERYAFDVDWSGRLVGTVVAQVDGTVASIKDTTWQADAPLFPTAAKPQVTYHPTIERSWTCRAGASEASCRASPGGFTRADTTWTALTPIHWNNALLYVATRQTTQDSEAYDTGDRAQLTTFNVTADASNFRVRDTRVESVARAGATDQTYRRTDKTWDAAFKTLLLETVYVEAAIVATTKRDYDLTGNVIRVWKPEQYAANSQFTTITYDAKKLYPIEQLNELGHIARTTHDYGTGAVIRELGPNSRSCGAGCPSDPTLPTLEGKQTTIDGLGRPLEIQVTRAHPANDQAYKWSKVESYAYVDTSSGATPTSVTHKTVIAFDTTRETTTRTDLDGHGRPFKSIESVNSTAPTDALTTYVYGVDGKLISVTVPDPSVNTTARVTFDYTFDSIGRPIGIRRPDATVPADRSGSDVTYDGLIETRIEVVGAGGASAGGPTKTQLEKDAFGRLIKVREFTTGTAFAETVYSFSSADEVSRIVDPEGVTTALVHDMGGRRTSISRGTRTWTYRYDKNGNITAEIAPYGTIPPGDEIKYTTSFAYDPLDRVTSKAIGSRELVAADVNLFGAAVAVYDWDDPAYNRIGRLAGYETKGTSGPAVYSASFRYDPQGNATEEKRAWGIPISTGSVVFPVRGETYHYEANGRIDKVGFADGIDGGEVASAALTEYDNRGNPLDLKLQRTGMADAIIAVQTRNVAGLVTKRRTTQAAPMTSLESNWTYDKLGRVLDQSVIKNGVTATPVVRQSLGYFGNDDPKFLDHAIGTNRKRFEYTYDKRHQLTNVAETVAGNAFSASYAFGQAGRFRTANVVPTNLPGREARPRNVTYLYSGTDPEQLTELRTAAGSYATYAYDAAGNQLRRTYFTDAALPPQPLGTAQTWTFTYDGDDQLRRVVTPGPSPVTEEYWYDDSGQRALIRTKPASGAITWRWFHDNTEVEWQTDDAADLTPSVTKTYANAALGTPVARITNRNDSTEFQFHGLGSSTLATVESGFGVPTSGAGTAGTLNAAFFYSPFGEILETTGTQLPIHRRRMNDKYQDASSGLGYYGYRYYDNTAMTWTQADPLFRFAPDSAYESPRQAHLYTFTLNNPLSYLDPDGRLTTEEGHQIVQKTFQSKTTILDVLEGIVIAAVVAVAIAIPPAALIEGAIFGPATVGVTMTVIAGGASDGEGGGLMPFACGGAGGRGSGGNAKTPLPEPAAGAPLASRLEGHSADQGFSGAYNPATGDINIRPSTSASPTPDGFVPRRGGHSGVSQEMGHTSDNVGFTAFLNEDGTLRTEFRSGQLNGRFPQSTIPSGNPLRAAINGALSAATGRNVIE